ncbi:hypothetical protein, variant [Aphanomyces astaci]|uniref:RBR-type E3 ubiquitin transferase n=1 Tax=Aphanomyces astaci TaxID=112090 RepID=W4H107_APHAT|nr:hypothetical protein, variant [Aphanomyces astaci]ETV84843.1 hypothetical protein, variant [Aphanomyces astaci]|eukprot:XP_009826535.1 hypothetical protein, variant [Aphanomyces astaci]
MDADESYFSRLWEAESPEALLEVLLEIQSKIDAMTARDGGNVSAVCIISTLDSHERQNARLWTSTAIDIKHAIHDRVVETPATPRKLTLVKEASDPSYALNVLMRLTSFGRSMSGAGGGSAATTPGGGFHHTHHPSLEHNIIDQQPSATDSLLRSLGSLMGFVETCYCQICLEYVDVATTIALDACGHRFCIECLEGYVTSKITDGMVYPTCFFAFPPEDGGAVPSTCHAAIQATDLRALITSEDVWAKYEKFKFNKEHANARECPHCHHVQVSAAANPTISCDACRQVYCFSHSNAHPGMSCADYEKARRAEDKLNHAKISQIAKFCPGCKSPVEKSGGCNQMKCITCGINFCWLCGQEVGDGVFPEHFQVRPVPPSHRSYFAWSRVMISTYLCTSRPTCVLLDLLVYFSTYLCTCCGRRIYNVSRGKSNM